MFRDQIECLEAIGTALLKAVPEAFERILVKADLDEESVNLLITYVPKGQVSATGNIPYVPMLARYFHELASLVSHDGKGLYRTCTYTLEQDGRYHADYSY